MQLALRYGNAIQPVDVPDRNLLQVLEPHDCRAFHDTANALGQAIQDCRGFLEAAGRVLVLVNDYTRPTPNEPILNALDPLLADRNVKILVCTGTHRAPREAELGQIFGGGFLDRHRPLILCHDCEDRSRLFFIGRTSFGTGVWFNRELLWADRVITVNSIEPHYFAGYTGGRKGFLPGIAGLDTIAQNHNMVTRSGSAVFSTKGNPVHEDMTEAARMVPRPVFSIQLVQGRNHDLLALHYGDLLRTFEGACAQARRVFAVPITQKADIVLSVLGPPYDINFYQSQRAVEFARPALKSPGIQITVSACRDGIGNDGFIRAFRGCKAARDVLQCTESDARLGWHKSARLAQIMETAELYTVTGLDDSVPKSVFMQPFHSIQEALDLALFRMGQDAKVYVIPDAGAVVPVLGRPDSANGDRLNR